MTVGKSTAAEKISLDSFSIAESVVDNHYAKEPKLKWKYDMSCTRNVCRM
ncbi:MAG: hypothetical protein ACOZCL_00615 [Bacillota bacterium]